MQLPLNLRKSFEIMLFGAKAWNWAFWIKSIEIELFEEKALKMSFLNKKHWNWTLKKKALKACFLNNKFKSELFGIFYESVHKTQVFRKLWTNTEKIEFSKEFK